jgi:hypothetical protein
MGYRSTLVSQYYDGILPDWFKKKYDDKLLFPNGVMICSKTEFKIYDDELFDDYRNALIECGWPRLTYLRVWIVVMSEDAVCTPVGIGIDDNIYLSMWKGSKVNHVWMQGQDLDDDEQ